LQDLHDSRADEKFQEYYMTYITREHADDLETLRSAPDFTDRSLPLLIRALRSGVDIFNKEEKATIVGLAQEGETH
jgi:ribosome assembly protein 3